MQSIHKDRDELMIRKQAKPKDSFKVQCAHDALVETDKRVPNPRNPNTHSQKQIELLSKIIKYQGWRNPIVVSNRSGFIVKGHARLEAAKLLGCKVCPVDFQDYVNEADEWADMVADNRLAELAENDLPKLKDLLGELDTGAFDMELTGFDEASIEELMTQFNPDSVEHKTLSEKFIIPPFSVLDARQGYWQERKASWLALGIQSEVGRGGANTSCCASHDRGAKLLQE